MRRPIRIALWCLALTSCSFTTAGDFTECANDFDCGAVAACSEGYCLPLPLGCKRESLPGTVDPSKQASRIPIVAIIPLNAVSGRDDSEAQGLNAIKLAISEANPRLDETRGTFGLFSCDTDSAINPRGIDEQGPWFIENLHVPAMIISSSAPVLRMAQNEARVDAGTFIISPNATSPGLVTAFQTNGNVWRVAPPDNLQAKVMADLIAGSYPDAGTKIAIIQTSGEYGDGFGIPLFEDLTARGYVTTRRPFTQNDSVSRASAVTSVSNEDSPAATVLIAFPNDVIGIIDKARTLPVLNQTTHKWFLGDAAKDPAILTDVTRPLLNDSIGTAPAQGAGSAYASFREAYRTAFQIDPNSFSYTSHSYDATWVMMLATQFAEGKDPVVRANVTGPRLGTGMPVLAYDQGPSTSIGANTWLPLSTAISAGTETNIEGTSGPLNFDLDAGYAISSYEVWKASGSSITIQRLVTP